MDKAARQAYILNELAKIGISVRPLDPIDATGKDWHIVAKDGLGRIRIETKYPPCACSEECRKKFLLALEIMGAKGRQALD